MTHLPLFYLTHEQYIEFDEEYVFICSHTQVHVYSRSTQNKVISLPPETEPDCHRITSPPLTETAWALGFSFNLMDDVEMLPRQPLGQNNDVGEGEYYENWMGSKTGQEDYPGLQERRNWVTGSPGRLHKPRDFSAWVSYLPLSFSPLFAN